MRIVKGMLLVVLAFVVAGCACHTRKVGEGDNIPMADNGGPLKDINFAFDSYKVDAVAKDILTKNAEWLKANPGHKVEIEGHCDERGTSEYNMVLGKNRAKAAYDELRKLGIAADSLSTVSYGKELPLDPRHNEEAWAKNRRDHFKVN